MDAVQGYAEVNGTRLYYEVAGMGEPLVLVHGFSLDTRMWDDQFAAFAAQYRVLRYDLRGAGRSAVPEEAPYYHHEDLAALLDHLGIERTHVIGLSMGGAVSLEFALAYPERVNRLVVVDTVLWGYEWSRGEWGVYHIWMAGQREGAEAARALWLGHPFFAPALANEQIAPRLRQIVGEYSGWDWTHRDPGQLPEPPAAQRLAAISAPTLSIVGALDSPDMQAISNLIVREIPNAHQLVLSGVGHMANMEAPDEFNAAVLGFLGE